MVLSPVKIAGHCLKAFLSSSASDSPLFQASGGSQDGIQHLVRAGLFLLAAVSRRCPNLRRWLLHGACRRIQRPAYQFPGYRIERAYVTYFEKNSATSLLFQKVKEQKQKGQPHREDSTATTQRNPIVPLRKTGRLRLREEASRLTRLLRFHDAPRNTRYCA